MQELLVAIAPCPLLLSADRPHDELGHGLDREGVKTLLLTQKWPWRSFGRCCFGCSAIVPILTFARSFRILEIQWQVAGDELHDIVKAGRGGINRCAGELPTVSDAMGVSDETGGGAHMSDAGFGVPARLRQQEATRQAIRRWRDGLVNLTGRNRLLNFKPSKTGMVAVARPAPGEVLMRRGRWVFRALQPGPSSSESFTPPPPRPGFLDVDKSPDELAVALRSLYRRSTQAYLDQGLSVLYLGRVQRGGV
jgi:Protein of unknown function (DUF4011)